MIAEPESPRSEKVAPLSPTTVNDRRNQHSPIPYATGPTIVGTSVTSPKVNPVVRPTLKTRSPTIGDEVPVGTGSEARVERKPWAAPDWAPWARAANPQSTSFQLICGDGGIRFAGLLRTSTK